jgi:hypothetical protein
MVELSSIIIFNYHLNYEDIPMSTNDKIYYVNFNTSTDFNSKTDLGFACSVMEKGKPKSGMKDIEAKVAAGEIVPARRGDDLRENPEIGLYYIPVRIREVLKSDADIVVSGGGMLSPSGSKIAVSESTESTNEAEVPS